MNISNNSTLNKSAINQQTAMEALDPLTQFTLEDLRILKVKQVAATCGHARSTLYKLISEKKFPRPVSLGGKSVGWHQHTIVSYLASLGAK